MTTDQLKDILGDYKWSLLVAVIMLAMVGFGYQVARMIDEGDSKKVQAQKETIAILSKENHALTTKVNQLEVAVELASLETEKITSALGEQKKEIEAQQELISFYERVMAPEKTDAGFAIEGVEAFKLGDGSYQLRMVLLQSKQNKAVINGNLSITIVGKRNGEPVRLTSGKDSMLEEDVKYRFRFFQAVNVMLSIDSDIEVDAIELSTTVYQYKTRKDDYKLSIPWSDAISTELD